MNKRMIIILAGIMAAVVAAVFLWQSRQKPVSEMDYRTLWQKAEAGQVERVILGSGPSLIVETKDGARALAPNPRYNTFKSDLLLAGVSVEEQSDKELNSVLSLIMLGALAAVFLRGKGQGAMARYAQISADLTVPEVSFRQVAGGGEALRSMQDLVDFLKSPEQFASYGARVPRGVLLYGPPGTGKTLMARALAGEAGVPFFAVNGSDFVQVYVGVGASRIRSLFQKARKAGSAVIFIDEIDAIGKKRDNGNDEREQTLNALLTEMSGFAKDTGVIVLAATNRLDTLDEALLRAGRFDRQIEVGLPDVRERLAILQVHASKLPMSEDVELEQIAKQTPFFSGASLENLLNEAAILAARRAAGSIEPQDMDKALIHLLAGQEKKDKQILDKEKEIICVHEAGHALAACIKTPGAQISRVTVIPSGKGAAGYVMSVPEDKLFQSRKELHGHLVVILSGRAAEEVAYGADGVTTGAAGDLKKAWQLALEMVNNWGMSPSGQIMEPAARQQEAAACLVEAAYLEAKELIISNRHIWENLKRNLMENETLTGDRVKAIVEM